MKHTGLVAELASARHRVIGNSSSMSVLEMIFVLSRCSLLMKEASQMAARSIATPFMWYGNQEMRKRRSSMIRSLTTRCRLEMSLLMAISLLLRTELIIWLDWRCIGLKCRLLPCMDHCWKLDLPGVLLFSGEQISCDLRRVAWQLLTDSVQLSRTIFWI